MSLIHDKATGPTGAVADSVGFYGTDMESGGTVTNFNTEGVGMAIGIRGWAHEKGQRIGFGTMAVVLTPEDTEELRQQLNAWFGRKATLSEVKNG